MAQPIDNLGLALAYLLAVAPLAVMLWLRVPLVGKTVLAIVRMSVQLLLVGLYLHILFELDRPWLNTLWLGGMIVVADGSILHHARLSWRRFGLPVFIALVIGTAVPLVIFLKLVLDDTGLFDARLMIPISGMILGNCLRAEIVGIRHFHDALRDRRPVYLLALSQGATLGEASRPLLRGAVEAALAPTVASMATIGLVSLPGMMTGVILGGGDPATAVRYQVAIMLAILAGTALAVPLALVLSSHQTFDPLGLPRRR